MPANNDDDHDDFGGLHRDVPRLVDRRRALQWMGGLSLAGLVAACGSGGTSSDPPDGSAATTTTNAAASSSPLADPGTSVASVVASAGNEIPDETAGPFPADGSNGPNVLGEAGIVRADLTTSVGSLSGTADGVPTTIQLTVVDAATGDALPGAAVYLWHCTADGRYSIYEVSDQNYLRGVQVADAAGKLTFTTIFPGCYAGRWPHCHLELYDSLDAATAGSQATKVSQLAFPQADCEAVYSDGRYGDSTSNLGRLSLSTDNVFSDGWEEQLATVAGDATGAMTASLLVRV
jgi:protocatechuate 3,4-dioxygenase beta subunit